MDNGKIDLILEYALSNEDNLRLSSQIASVFDDIVSKLGIDFLIQLEKELQETLGDEWIIVNDLAYGILERRGFTISKENWKDLYCIGFFAEKTRLRNFDFFIWRNTSFIKNPNIEINEKLNENYKKGNVYKNGDWWQYVDREYKNWTNEDTLIKLYNKVEMVNYFKEQILKIKDIIESIVDEEVKKY